MRGVLTFAIVVLIVALVCVVCSSVTGDVISLFDENIQFATYMTSRDSAKAEVVSPGYLGLRALRVTVTDDHFSRGQVYNSSIPGWSYKIVANPIAPDEARWLMFSWKKPTGGGIMIQLANNGVWGDAFVTSKSRRYLAGFNLFDRATVQLTKSAPISWDLHILDLYGEFGPFTLTGIAFTPMDGEGWYDTIYLAHTQKELLTIIEPPSAPTNVFVKSPNSVRASDTFTIDVSISKATNVAAYSFDVVFNPDVLQVESVTDGGFITSRGPGLFLNPKVDNRTGRIIGAVAVRAASGDVGGDGSLLMVKFQAREEGSSYIKIENLLVVTSYGVKVSCLLTNAPWVFVTHNKWDVDRNGVVDVYDLIIVVNSIGKSPTSIQGVYPDVDCNGIVDIQDLILVLQHLSDVYIVMAPARFNNAYMDELSKAYQLLKESNSDPILLNLVSELMGTTHRTQISTWGQVRYRR